MCIKLEAAPDASKLRGDPDWLVQGCQQPDLECAQILSARRRGLGCHRVRATTLSASRCATMAPAFPTNSRTACSKSLRKPTPRTRATKGSVGLGLSIVKQIVKRLGGEAGFANSPGGGAIFHVELPAWGKKIATNSAIPCNANCCVAMTKGRQDSTRRKIKSH